MKHCFNKTEAAVTGRGHPRKRGWFPLTPPCPTTSCHRHDHHNHPYTHLNTHSPYHWIGTPSRLLRPTTGRENHGADSSTPGAGVPSFARAALDRLIDRNALDRLCPLPAQHTTRPGHPAHFAQPALGRLIEWNALGRLGSIATPPHHWTAAASKRHSQPIDRGAGQATMAWASLLRGLC